MMTVILVVMVMRMLMLVILKARRAQRAIQGRHLLVHRCVEGGKASGEGVGEVGEGGECCVPGVRTGVGGSQDIHSLGLKKIQTKKKQTLRTSGRKDLTMGVVCFCE